MVKNSITTGNLIISLFLKVIFISPSFLQFLSRNLIDARRSPLSDCGDDVFFVSNEI